MGVIFKRSSIIKKKPYTGGKETTGIMVAKLKGFKFVAIPRGERK